MKGALNSKVSLQNGLSCNPSYQLQQNLKFLPVWRIRRSLHICTGATGKHWAMGYALPCTSNAWKLGLLVCDWAQIQPCWGREWHGNISQLSFLHVLARDEGRSPFFNGNDGWGQLEGVIESLKKYQGGHLKSRECWRNHVLCFVRDKRKIEITEICLRVSPVSTVNKKHYSMTLDSW